MGVYKPKAPTDLLSRDNSSDTLLTTSPSTLDRAQVFVRFHFLHLVGWDIEGIVGPIVGPEDDDQLHESTRERFRVLPGSDCPPIDWRAAGFHDVIGKFFQQPEHIQFSNAHGASYTAPVVYYRRLDIEEGMFRFVLSPRTQRHFLSRGFTYCVSQRYVRLADSRRNRETTSPL